MGMATFTDDMDKVRKEFEGVATSFCEIKTLFFEGNDDFQIYPWVCQAIIKLP